MAGVNIKIFLVHGDPKRLRIAEISNWTGKAIVGPRSEFDSVLARSESSNSGVYFLTGSDPDTGNPALYIGEAESIKDRVKRHLGKDFWNQIVFFVSKDENLTKSHIRYCEGRLIEIAKHAGRAVIKNIQRSGAKLPEADREEMEVFLEKMQLLLPAIGVDLLLPMASELEKRSTNDLLTCSIHKLKATGYLTPNGMVVLKGSQAVLTPRESSSKYPWSVMLREKLKADGSLVQSGDHLKFAKDVEFSSPSAAATVIQGGQANGLIAWKNQHNKSLKELETV